MPAASIHRRRIEEALDQLPPRKVVELARYADWLCQREGTLATEEITSNPELLSDIREALRDSRNEKGKPWRQVRRNV